MGYYTGNGVTRSKRSYTNCIWNQWVPTWILDGKPMGWVCQQVYRNYTETETVKMGVQEPTNLTSSSQIDNNGVLVNSSTQNAQRIGDSNLWSLITNTISGANA